MRDGLPQGWLKCEVQKVFKSFGGGTPDRSNPAYWGGTIPWLSSGDIKSDRIHESSESITKAALDNSSANVCRNGSLLIVVRSGILKHTLPIAILKRQAAINQDIKCFDSGDDTLNEWLSLALRSSEREILALNREGTTVQSVKYETLKQFKLPVPPLPEQRRVVAKLEKLLGKLDACQKRLEKIPLILKRFRQSVLAAACSGRLTEDWREANKVEGGGTVAEIEISEEFPDAPHSWDWKLLNSLCDESKGITYGVIKLGAEFVSGVPYLRTSDIKPLKIENDHVKRISPQISSNYARTVLKGSEVLVSVRGTLGGVAVVPKEMRGWNISREVAMVPVLKCHNPEFVAFWIASAPSQRWLTGVVKGVAYTGINLEDLRLLPVALPSPEEQKEIVSRVKSLLTTADQIEVRYQKAKAHVDKLTQSILAKAFRGELVPQDPTDEPADVLLERIRSKH